MNDKKAYRREVTLLLNSLPDGVFEAAGQAALEALQSTALWRQAQSVFCFYGVKNEVNTVPILTAALNAGKRLYLPRCIKGIAGAMESVRVCDLSGLEKSSHGLLEPTGSETAQPEEIDISIVPCLAVTPDGVRLGHGGGYYDRFLCRFKGASIALCPQAAVLSRLPQEEHDVSVDFIMTENGLIKAEKGNL